MTRFLKGFASLVTLAALVVGAPLVLLQVGRWDGLTRLRPSSLLAPTDSAALVLSVMTLAAWLAWAVVAASVVAEVVGALTRGRVHLHVPGGGWVQPLVGSLVMAAFGLVVAPSASAQAGPPVASPSPVVSPAAPGQAQSSGHHQHAEVIAAESGHQKAAQDPQEGRHVVQRGDDLWSVAVQHYGDGMQWRRIVADNHLDPTAELVPGKVLVLRGLPERTVAVPQEELDGSVVVEQGDTLSGLAAEHLGNAERWPEIDHLNHDVVHDPDHIEPGWELRLPEAGRHVTGSAAPASASAKTGSSGLGRPARPGAPATTTVAAQSTAAHASAAHSTTAHASPVHSSAAHPSTAPTVTTAPASGPARPVPPVARPSAPVVSATPHWSAAPSPTSTGAVSTPASRGATPAATAGGRGIPAPSRPAADTPALGPLAPSVTASATATHSDTAAPSMVPVEDGEAMAPAAHEESDPSLVEIGGIGVLLAASVSAAVVRRRRQQLSTRPAGRRVPQLSPQARRFEADLAHVAATAPEPPDEVGPTSALVGGRGSEFVTLDVEQARVATITGPAVLVDDLVAGLTTGLALQPWSCETSLVVQGDLPLLRALDEPQVTLVASVKESVDALERLVADRRAAMSRLGAEGTRPTLGALRADDDTWEAWRPVVHVITSGATPELRDRLVRLLDGPALGIGVVLAHVDAESSCLHVLDERTARIDAGEAFAPYLVDATARRALLEIFDAVGSPTTTPAPWWCADDDLPPTITALRRRPALDLDEEEPVEPSADQHPTLYLLGPLDLRGCRGEEPARARRQCIEYCAWIAMNPGRTATMMSRQLLVAEGTRRSNLSRLRTWLGNDPNGEPYLPDAYSGRIELHPGITSDWEHFELLTSGGVNRCSTDALVDAMRLVRGAPLADAAPGQWTWAEEVRVDMMSTIRDAAVVLAQRAMDEHDLDLARWAAARGLTAAPNDELLLCARLRTEHLAGNRPEVERLVLQVTRAARNLGVDLRDETIALLQEVMEGRRRTA